jgi:hypothetical protein
MVRGGFGWITHRFGRIRMAFRGRGVSPDAFLMDRVVA